MAALPPRLAQALALIGGISVASAGMAQSDARLTSERDAVFAQLLFDPANRELMADYVRLSVLLRDYESAAATLERLVAMEPGNTAALLELAQAYIGIGAFDLANVQLAAVLASGAPPDQIALATALQRRAQSQGDESRFNGRISIGPGYETQTGPGTNGQIALTWRIDMGGPHAHDWVTEFGATGFSSGDGSDTLREFYRIRTGPEFRITGESFGPRLRPYLQVTASRDTSEGDSAEFRWGVAFQSPHSPYLNSFADMSMAVAEDLVTGEQSSLRDLAIGLTLRPTSSTSLRLTYLQSEESGGPEARESYAARVDVSYQFGAPFGSSGRDWMLGGHVLHERAAVDGFRTSRTEDSMGYGGFFRAYITDGAYVEARATRVERNSSFPNFRSDETIGSLQFGWEF